MKVFFQSHKRRVDLFNSIKSNLPIEDSILGLLLGLERPLWVIDLILVTLFFAASGSVVLGRPVGPYVPLCSFPCM